MTTSKPQLWTSGDWNAFFGFGTNILVNLLTLTALLRFVLKMPDDLVNIPWLLRTFGEYEMLAQLIARK